jgi:DNA-binding LacI/PurR family transcriptional regulator
MSIIEIANRTGISKSTVSRVLNNGSVSKSKRQLIEQAIKDIGYQIPKVRRGPKKNRKRDKIAIGLLFLEDNFCLLQNPETYYPLLLNSLIENRIKEEVEVSPHFFTSSSLTSEDLNSYNAFIIFGSVPGNGIVSDSVEKLLKKLPAVYIQGDAVAESPSNPLEDIDRVYYENQLVGCIAAKHLIGKGHKRLAFLSPYYRHPIHDVRMNSFTLTARYHHIPNSLYIQNEPQKGSPTYADVDKLVEQMVKSDQLPEGLFVTADIRTVHVYNALSSRGIKPMEDIDIISCDNVPFFTEQMNPKPAEIDTNITKVASAAIELLQQRIKEGKGEPKTVLVRPKLIV